MSRGIMPEVKSGRQGASGFAVGGRHPWESFAIVRTAPRGGSLHARPPPQSGPGWKTAMSGAQITVSRLY